MRYLLILLALSSSLCVATTTCGSGSTAAALELNITAFPTAFSNGSTIVDEQSVSISSHWNWASTSHPATDWHLDTTYDSTTTSTGWKSDAQTFQSSPISWGYGFGTPALSLGSHTITAKLTTGNGVTCTDTFSFNVEAAKIVGAASVDANGLVTGGACIAGVTTGKERTQLRYGTVTLRAGGATLGTATASLTSPVSPVASTCGNDSSFKLQLTEKQRADFCGQSITASMAYKNGELSFTGGKIPACQITPIQGRQVVHRGGLCIGAASPSSGMQMFLLACNTPPKDGAALPASLTLRGDGNIEFTNFPGYCLHPEGGSSNPVSGTKLVAWQACGESKLQFEYTANNSLRHVLSGKCIHPEGGSADPVYGTKLVFWDGCDEDRLRFFFVP